MATTKSIIQDLNDDFILCFFNCGRQGTELHHCLHGTANRRIADKYGLTVMLCSECHRKLHDKNVGDEILQMEAQRAFERQCGTRLDFINLFGKNYL